MRNCDWTFPLWNHKGQESHVKISGLQLLRKPVTDLLYIAQWSLNRDLQDFPVKADAIEGTLWTDYLDKPPPVWTITFEGHRYHHVVSLAQGILCVLPWTAAELHLAQMNGFLSRGLWIMFSYRCNHDFIWTGRAHTQKVAILPFETDVACEMCRFYTRFTPSEWRQAALTESLFGFVVLFP